MDSTCASKGGATDGKKNIPAIRRQMIDAVDHEVEARIAGGYRPCVGKCINYTQPLDNDPEIASIDIQVP